MMGPGTSNERRDATADTRAYRIKRIAAIILCAVALTACRGQANDDDDLLLALALLSATNRPNPTTTNVDYYGLFNQGMESWDIKLAIGNVAATRILSAGTTLHNPRNWLTATPDNCNAIGVTDYQREHCFFNDGSTTVGLTDSQPLTGLSDQPARAGTVHEGQRAPPLSYQWRT